MTSLFTRFVARGVEVPVVQTHLKPSEVVTANEGQAATVATTNVETAPVKTDQQASSGTSNAVDGTQSPK